MRNSRALMMLALSVVAGLAAVFLAARWMSEQAGGSHSRVLVASRDLELGQALTPLMLQEIPWPSPQLAGSFSDAKKLEGRVVRTHIFKGEPILAPKLAPEGTKAGLDSVIKGGRRAITVKVNEVVGVAGFLAPGSYVDLLVNVKDNRDNPLSKIVLERIMVLAVAQESSRGDETRARVVNAVTLEVTPQEAEKIDLARNIGTLSLMLRNQVDLRDNVTSGARRNDLLGVEEKVMARTPAPPLQAASPRRSAPARPALLDGGGNRIEVIRGVQKASSDF